MFKVKDIEQSVYNALFCLPGQDFYQRWKEISAAHSEPAEEGAQQLPGVSETRVQTTQGTAQRGQEATLDSLTLILIIFHYTFPFIAIFHCRSWMRTSPHQRRRSRSGCPSRRRTSSTSRQRRRPIYSANSGSIWSLSAAGSNGAFSLHVTTWSKISWERLADRELACTKTHKSKVGLLMFPVFGFWTEPEISKINQSDICLFSGAEQASNTEGSRACHAAPTPWVHAGARVQAPEHYPEDAGRADPPAASNWAHQPAGVQQAQGEGAQTQTCYGGPTAA